MSQLEILTPLKCLSGYATFASMKTKQPRDISQLAKMIVEKATNEEKPIVDEQPQKNQAAVELRRLGGKKGGKARAEKLAPEQRKEIAKLAAQARWKKPNT